MRPRCMTKQSERDQGVTEQTAIMLLLPLPAEDASRLAASNWGDQW